MGNSYKEPPDSRRCQFTPRAILVVLITMSVCLSPCAWRVVKFRAARAAVRNVNGRFDVAVESGVLLRPFVLLFGEDLVSHLQSVDVSGCLEDLTNLRELDLSYTRITSAGLTRLTCLQDLSMPLLGHMDFRDGPALHLPGQLEYLSLADSQLCETSLASLTDVKSLRFLELSRATGIGVLTPPCGLSELHL